MSAPNPAARIAPPAPTATPGHAPRFDTPRLLLLAALILSALGLLSSFLGIYLAFSADKPVWFLLAFECIALMAGVLGVLTGLGRFASGPALALARVAGAFFGASLLGYLAAGPSVQLINMKSFLLARTGLAACLALVAALAVLSRKPRASLPLLARSIIAGALLAAAIAAAWMLRTSITTWPGAIQAVVGLVGFVWILATLAATVHFAIRAFESGE